MKTIIAAAGLAVLMLTGCTTWKPETQAEEATFLTLHAVDGLQTANIATMSNHGGCGGQIHCYERESAWAIGCDPSPRSTAAYFAALAVAHVAITNLMVEHDAPNWMLRTWELVSIGWDVRDVSHNAEIGIRLYSK